MAETNVNSRLEAFCDGVFAIALTLLIIDIKVPSKESINSTTDLWIAISHIVPSLFSFILSFIVILITWVNHHGNLVLIHKTSSSFMYANGFLLLTVVIIPFPTAMLGEYVFTNYAAPAVILYDAVLAIQSVGWILISKAAIKNNLAKNEKSVEVIRKNGQFGYFAFILYSACAIVAFWFPLTIAVITTITWLFWLVFGIRIKHE